MNTVRMLRQAGAARPRAVLPALEGALLLAGLVAPWFLHDHQLVFATRILILCLLALSFDLLWGYAGIMSFGQAAFFGVAGYAVGLAAREWQLRAVLAVLPLSLLAGLAMAGALAAFLLLGRRRANPVFVALGTLTAGYVAERIARSWSFVGGHNGLPSLPQLTLGGHTVGDGAGFYALVFGVLVLCYGACRLAVRSQFGLALAGLRENEQRAEFLGYRTTRLKALVFLASGALAGLSGGLYAFHDGFVWPGMLGLLVSTQVVLFVLLGGRGTLVGAALGATALELLGHWLADFAPRVWPVVLGLVLLAVILFRPAGLVSLLVGERERAGCFGGDKQRGGR